VLGTVPRTASIWLGSVWRFMVRVGLAPGLWGDRQELTVKDDWSQLSIEECQRRALALIGIVEEMREQRLELKRLQELGPRRIVYDPTDGDELAECEAREAEERARTEAEESDAPDDIAR
jgi:hypothetical protein